MCALWGGDTDERRRDAGAKVVGRQHGADVILSKGCAEPTARAIIQTPCSGVHLHNFMALHGRFSCARAAITVSRAELSARCFESFEQRARETRRTERQGNDGRGNHGTIVKPIVPTENESN